MWKHNAIAIEDQPISATFFDEGKWLTSFITPNDPDIQVLWSKLTANIAGAEAQVISAWDWVAKQIRYVPYVKASINIEGKRASSDDFWQSPSMCSKTGVGNCANKAFLLTSLLRNVFAESSVHCVLGNLHNGHVQGHAWVEVIIDGIPYIVESTRDDVPLIDARKATRYEAVHYMNDKEVLAIPGKTVMTPFSACYSSWLKDYLDWTYINNGGANGHQR